MACRKITLNVGAITARRPLTCLSAERHERKFSSGRKDEEIKTVTHTGQVMFTPQCYANTLQFRLQTKYIFF